MDKHGTTESDMIGLDIPNQHECSQSDTPHRGDILFYGQNQKMESLNSIDQILPSIKKNILFSCTYKKYY